MSAEDKKEDGSLYPDVLIEGHDYDGIEEYDNPMPGWWLWIFYATIVWSIFYVVALGVGWIAGYDEQLQRETAAIEELRVAAAAQIVPVDEEAILAAMEDPEALEAGAEAYRTFCVACHGVEYDGGIGPSLVDGHWIHGDAPGDIYRVISDGGAGMPPHAHLGEERIAALVAFILSL